MSFFKRKKPRNKIIPNKTPQAIEAQNQAAQMFSQQFPGFYESLGYDPEAISANFEQTVAAPARQQFAEQGAPLIQERAIGSGTGRGSAVQRQLTTGASNLESSLAGQLSQQQMEGKKSAQEMQMEALLKALGIGTGSVGDGYAIPGKPSGYERMVNEARGLIKKAIGIL